MFGTLKVIDVGIKSVILGQTGPNIIDQMLDKGFNNETENEI